MRETVFPSGPTRRIEQAVRWLGRGSIVSLLMSLCACWQSIDRGSPTPTREPHAADGGMAMASAARHDTKSRDAGTTLAAPSGPIAAPSGLWQPAAGSTPEMGTYVYVESEAGDPVGGGATFTYTHANAVLTITFAEDALFVRVTSDETWVGEFIAMERITELVPGYYGELTGIPYDPTRGGLTFARNEGGVTSTGWFVIDALTHDQSTLTALDFRFEQRSRGSSGALHGKIHIVPDDPTRPPGPVTPAPDDLWQPAASATPLTGNYLYLESDPGDAVGRGQTLIFGGDMFTLAGSDASVSVSVAGPEPWDGEFVVMYTLSRLEPGYYGDVQRFPFDNPVKAALTWSADSAPCNSVGGWFVVDSVSYEGQTLTALDLRFEQHCDLAAPALRGQVHYRRN